MTISRMTADQLDGGANVTRFNAPNDIVTKMNEVVDAHNGIQSGSEAVSAAADLVVTFPVAFASVPRVVATANKAAGAVTHIDTVSETGCKIYFTGAFTGTVDWIATIS
jgi:hypothetical protein